MQTYLSPLAQKKSFKIGTGSLTLNGVVITTNTDSATYTNYLYTPAITYVGNTTISNGVLVLSNPNSLSNSPSITLAGTTAVLDASSLGYISNFNDPVASQPDQALVTNGVFEVLGATPFNGTPQTLNGFGTIRGSLLADFGSTLNPGNATGVITNGTGTGVLNVTNQVSIFGAVNMRLNTTNAVIADEITAASFAIDPGATLNITNIGNPLTAGSFTFHLFNHPVSFANVTLPTVSSPLTLQNNLAVDGTILVIDPRPVAGFSAITPTNGASPLAVTFTNTSTGAGITNWFWDFGDGNTLSAGAGTNVTHTYTTPGTNNVILTVTSPSGASALTNFAYIVVTNASVAAPVSAFGSSSVNIFVTQTVLFTNTSTGSFTNSAWSFGDGNVTNLNGASVSNNVSDTYLTAGTYPVQLIVTGAGGSSTNTPSFFVTVKPKPVLGKPVLSGGNFIFNGTNGAAGAQYRILTTTNIALSLSNWTPVLTNTVGGDGSYGYTNSSPTNKASFFLLVSP
jgi:PKD repeat protein